MLPRRLALLLLLCWPALAASAMAAPVTVAAAADLRGVMPGLVAAFGRQTGMAVQPVYGASGSLVQQMLNGAPHQLLLAADDRYPARLVAAGRAAGPVRPYALGRLALLVRAGHGITDWPGFAAALAAGRIGTLAIANPDTAPYGRAAQAVLHRAGLWPAAQPRLLLGENVAQAAQFVLNGGAAAGLVSAALAREAQGRGGVQVIVLPDGLAPPLVQSLVLGRGAGPQARAFADWITGPQGRARLAAAGFGLP